MNTNNEESSLDIARGDAALSKHLKNSLEVLKKKVEDPSFKSLVDEIVAGRKSLRDTFLSNEFSKALDPLAQKGVEDYSKMSDEEREELARAGEEQFEQMRNERPQNAPGRRTGSECEEDDDFSDTTWLQ